MMELIDILQDKIKELDYGISTIGINTAIIEAQKLLEKEKEQIVQAWIGRDYDALSYDIDGEEYYSETFKQD